jgi:hypothetical protein
VLKKRGKTLVRVQEALDVTFELVENDTESTPRWPFRDETTENGAESQHRCGGGARIAVLRKLLTALASIRYVLKLLCRIMLRINFWDRPQCQNRMSDVSSPSIFLMLSQTRNNPVVRTCRVAVVQASAI